MATLLYHWKCDEGSGQTTSSAASANDGDLYDSTAGDRGVTWDASGKNGACLLGDGSSGAAIDYGVLTETELAAQPVDFTVMCWFNTSHPTGDVTAPMVACLNMANASFGIGIWMEPGNPGVSKVLGVIFADGLGRFAVVSPASVNYADGTWHHAALACRTDTDTLTLYMDCEVSSNLEIPGDIIASVATHRWWLSGGQVPVNYLSVAGAFDGYVDDIRVYDGYMTAIEICAAKNDFPPSVANAMMFSCNT